MSNDDLEDSAAQALQAAGVEGGAEYWRRVRRLAGGYAVGCGAALAAVGAFGVPGSGWLATVFIVSLALSAFVGVAAYIGAGVLEVGR